MKEGLDRQNSVVQGISAAILSGGSAKRLGGITKANLIVGGRTILSRILDAFEGIFSEVILVTNTPSEFIDRSSLKIVPDIIPGAGPLGGIHAALKAAQNEAVFIVAGDMPLLDRDLILRQIDLFATNRPDALIPQTGKYIEPLHSVYKTSVLPDLENFLLTREKRAVWEFLQSVRTQYFIPENESAATISFISFNSPEDAGRIEKIIQDMQ